MVSKFCDSLMKFSFAHLCPNNLPSGYTKLSSSLFEDIFVYRFFSSNFNWLLKTSKIVGWQ